MEKTPEMLFLSVETDGDGEIHAYSRVQMALADAKDKARHEFAEALAASGHSLEDIHQFVQTRPWLRSSTYSIPRHPGVISTAANLVIHVSELMGRRLGSRSTRIIPDNHSSRRPALTVVPSQQETNNV
jgi:hypothetical protein